MPPPTENPIPLHWAEWEGDDFIDKFYVYIFNGAGENASYETTQAIAGSEFEKNGDDDYTLKEPFLSTLGPKRVFVLVNLNHRLVTKINAKVTTGCTAKDFRDFLQSSGWSDTSISTVPTSKVTQTRADEFVTKVGGKNAIVMNGEPVDVVITEQTKETVKNNSTTESDALLAATVNSTTEQQFSEKYEPAELSLVAATGGSVADKVAKLKNNQHIILMTGAPITKLMEDGVTKFEASTGTRNNASVQFKRAVSRVLVTTTKGQLHPSRLQPQQCTKRERLPDTRPFALRGGTRRKPSLLPAKGKHRWHRSLHHYSLRPSAYRNRFQRCPLHARIQPNWCAL